MSFDELCRLYEEAVAAGRQVITLPDGSEVPAGLVYRWLERPGIYIATVNGRWRPTRSGSVGR